MFGNYQRCVELQSGGTLSVSRSASRFRVKLRWLRVGGILTESKHRPLLVHLRGLPYCYGPGMLV